MRVEDCLNFLVECIRVLSFPCACVYLGVLAVHEADFLVRRGLAGRAVARVLGQLTCLVTAHLEKCVSASIIGITILAIVLSACPVCFRISFEWYVHARPCLDFALELVNFLLVLHDEFAEAVALTLQLLHLHARLLGRILAVCLRLKVCVHMLLCYV